jgi:DNA-directed RNA polymerase subunit RPC12/RpoP
LKNLWKYDTWFFGGDVQHIVVCPHCKNTFKKDMNIDTMTYCPKCGKQNIVKGEAINGKFI